MRSRLVAAPSRPVARRRARRARRDRRRRCDHPRHAPPSRRPPLRHGRARHRQLHLEAAKGKLCWTFHVPTKGITRASIRDAHGMKVLELGMHYTAKRLRRREGETLELLEAHRAKYRVWVDTKGHPGDLRGRLVRRHGAHVAVPERRTPRETTWRRPGAIGRGVFLATVGRRRLARSPGASRSGATSPARSAAPRRSSRSSRRRAGGSTRSPSTMPTLRPGDVAPRRRRARRAAATLDYDELRSLPRAEQVSTFHCVTGWTVRTCAGAACAPTTCSPRPGRCRRRARSSSSPPSALRRLPHADRRALPDVLLAYEMDGQPMPREHGAPAAARDPGHVRLQERQVGRARSTSSPQPEPGYWEQRGYDQRRLGRPLERLLR